MSRDDHTIDLDAAREEIAQLTRALASRAVIERAKGMIMMLVPCSSDEAFWIIMDLAEELRRRPSDVASELARDLRSSVDLQAMVVATFDRQDRDQIGQPSEAARPQLS